MDKKRNLKRQAKGLGDVHGQSNGSKEPMKRPKFEANGSNTMGVPFNNLPAQIYSSQMNCFPANSFMNEKGDGGMQQQCASEMIQPLNLYEM